MTWAPTRLAFPLDRYPFPSLVAEALDEPDLTRLGTDRHVPLRVRATDQQTQWHQRFYATFGRWKAVFDSFVTTIVAPEMGTDFYVQAIPTLRVHLVGNLAVGEFHNDRRYGHPDGEITFWVPLTSAHGSNTLQLESAPGRGDHAPVEAEPGVAVAFDAANLDHGNVVNTTDATRVSFDFRCLPVSCPYSPSRRSINAGLEFRPGGYYAAHVVRAPANPGHDLDLGLDRSEQLR